MKILFLQTFSVAYGVCVPKYGICLCRSCGRSSRCLASSVWTRAMLPVLLLANLGFRNKLFLWVVCTAICAKRHSTCENVDNVLILNVFKSLQIYTLSGRSQSTFIVITINDFWVSPLMEQIKGFEEEPKDSLCFVFKFKSLSYQVWA